MIKPTIGRKVWFYPTDDSSVQPFDATIICVHSDRCVNLVVFDHVGEMTKPRSVQLVQDEDAVFGSHARWMPYQQATAKS